MVPEAGIVNNGRFTYIISDKGQYLKPTETVKDKANNP